MGRPMMKTQNVPLDDFSTGISEKTSIFANVRNGSSPEYGVRAAASAKNVNMGKDGIESCKGYREVLSAALGAEVTGNYEFVLEGMTTQRFHIVTAGTDIYSLSGSTATSIYSGLTAGYPCQFETFNGVVLIMNGIDDVVEWDGSGSATPTAMNDPDTIWDGGKPSFAAIFRNQLFYGGDPTQPYKIWKPAPGTHNDFDNTNGTVDGFLIGPGDGQAVTGIKPITHDVCLIYKKNKILGLSGSAPFGSGVDPFTIREVVANVGCIAPKSIVAVGKDHYFLSSEGFKSLMTVQQYGDIQDADPMYKLSRSFENINKDAASISKAFATYIPVEKMIYLHLPSGSNTENDTVFTYNVLTGATGIRDGITASCGAMINGQYYTGNYDGMVYQQLFGHNYAGGSIETSWESKWLFYNGDKKIFRDLQLYFESSNSSEVLIQIQIMKMDGSIFAVTGTAGGVVTDDLFDVGLFDVAIFDAGSSSIYKKANIGRGVAVKVKVINNSADQSWKLQKFEIGVVNLGRAAA